MAKRAVTVCPECGSYNVEKLGHIGGTNLIEYVCDDCDEYFEVEEE
jgi:transposase-like protein